MAHKFRDLVVWQCGMVFVTQIYELTRGFPAYEMFGLTSQIRRAALSIPLNVAEGAGSGSGAEFGRFLGIALRSVYETMTAIELAERLGYCERGKSEPLLREADELAAMLVGLAKRTRATPMLSTKPKPSTSPRKAPKRAAIL